MCGWSRRRASEGCTLWRSRSACSLPVSACPSQHAAWSRAAEPSGSRFAPERRSFSSPPGFAHLPLSFDIHLRDLRVGRSELSAKLRDLNLQVGLLLTQL